MKKTIVTALRILTGIIFIFSALSKLLSIDSFEIYIYSFNILNLPLSFLFARVVIGFELLLGVLFILNAYIKLVALSTLAMLLSFIVFLVYLIFTQNPENCHCFGDILEISHTTSIIKNIIIIGFVLVVLKQQHPSTYKFKTAATILGIVVSMAVPFIVSPPDNFNLSAYANKTSYNEQALQQYLAQKGTLQGKQVICFYGTGCRFCKLSSKKISVIAKKLNEKESAFSIVFWGDEARIEKFFTTTNSTRFAYETMDGNQFLQITDGQMPVILLLENGQVKKKYGYRDLNEEEILNFFEE